MQPLEFESLLKNIKVFSHKTLSDRLTETLGLLFYVGVGGFELENSGRLRRLVPLEDEHNPKFRRCVTDL